MLLFEDLKKLMNLWHMGDDDWTKSYTNYQTVLTALEILPIALFAWMILKNLNMIDLMSFVWLVEKLAMAIIITSWIVNRSMVVRNKQISKNKVDWIILLGFVGFFCAGWFRNIFTMLLPILPLLVIVWISKGEIVPRLKQTKK
ncbi:hypothetical protein JOC36_001493 [Weissella uvarum]|uniref:hypothetical protein n=1 Tax=Weissella uvarum TaxID=1479233 RepID=UPI001961BF4B|nr:hypothetical protein [Weissella uvarum]MBM7617900.1 hypothetical protein [Weissella uvarum]MCM0596102.1 hypothetical protein [Weissella uvarum]